MPRAMVCVMSVAGLLGCASNDTPQPRPVPPFSVDLKGVGTVSYDPARKTPVHAWAYCLRTVLDCAKPAADFATCVDRAPRCATATPWMGELGCCPAPCATAFHARTGTGAQPAEAFLSVFVEDASCMPGLAP